MRGKITVLFSSTLLLWGFTLLHKPKSIVDNFREFKLPKEDTIEYKRIPSLPKNFDTVPGGNNVFRTNQPSLNQLKAIIKAYKIDVVIRMNGEEGTGISPSTEGKLVKSLGKKFIYANAHLGYVKGKGYTKSLEIIQPYLHNGNVLIHCTHGADRTGYQVAKYIQDKLKWDRKELWYYTTKYNQWGHHIPSGKIGYIKYMEAFYPYDLWKKEVGRK